MVIIQFHKQMLPIVVPRSGMVANINNTPTVLTMNATIALPTLIADVS